jgi:Uma2 family endonuclease
LGETLEAIEDPIPMSTATAKKPATNEPRFAFRTDWNGYQALAKILETSADHVRIAFDGERVELRMSAKYIHEKDLKRLRFLVEVLADARHLPRHGLGMARWDRPEAGRGLESDATYYLDPAKIKVALSRPEDPLLLPLPDLAIEVDHSTPQIDRESIYRALGVGEVWRFDGADLEIDVLSSGTYAHATTSPALGVSVEEITAWVLVRGVTDPEWEDQVRNWAQARFGI